MFTRQRRRSAMPCATISATTMPGASAHYVYVYMYVHVYILVHFNLDSVYIYMFES